MHSKAMEDLRSAVDALAGVEVAALDAGTLGTELVELRVQMDRLEAHWLARLLSFDDRCGAMGDGAATTASWLRRDCRLAPGAARERVTIARRLRDLPATATALAEGAISYRHAALIANATADLPEAANDSASTESILLEASRGCDPATLRRVTTHLSYVLDPDGSRRRDAHSLDRGTLFVSPVLNRFAVNGDLNGEDGATVLAALAPLAAPVPGDQRTAAERRADALVELARRALDGGELPETGGVRPHVTVTVDLPTLIGDPGSAQLAWAGPVSGETARRLACDAGVTRVITAGPSELLDVGRATRVVPAAIRRALVIRDRGCRFPGCDRPPEWTDAHHLRHWADGGPTCLANLILLCRFHHRLLHEGGWQLTGDLCREVVAVRPDGTEIRPPPEPWLSSLAATG